MATFNRVFSANGEARIAPSTIRRMAAAGALMAGMVLAPAAMAGWYAGVNAGPMLIDRDGFDDPTNAGVLVGHEWGVAVGDIGVQAEFTTTIDDGAFRGHDVSIDTQALYGAFRTAGPVYVIAKAGVLHIEGDVGPVAKSDTDLAGGIGVGLSLGVVKLELEYALVGEDVSYLSLGLRF